MEKIETDKFNELLIDYSDAFLGDNLKQLRFLLYDHLTVSSLSADDISGFYLFNELSSRGTISSKDISILYEIAELMKIEKPIDCVQEYSGDTKPNTNVNEAISPYRKHLFWALLQTSQMDLSKLCAFYRIDSVCYKDIWDVVFYLESRHRLDSTYKTIRRFSKILNKKSENILSDFLNTCEAEPTSPKRLTGHFSAKTTDEDRKSAIKEMSPKSLHILMRQVSEWYHGKNMMNMLKVLFSDMIPGVESYSTAIDVFEALINIGELENKIRVLIDTVKVTETHGVLNSVEELRYFWDDTTPIISFKVYRQNLIKFGNNLTQMDSHLLGELHGIPQNEYNSDQWILIMILEKKGYIKECKIKSFIKDLKDINLDYAARNLEEITTD